MSRACGGRDWATMWPRRATSGHDAPMTDGLADPRRRARDRGACAQQIRHLAAFDTPGNPHVPTVLLQGETGTGKGLVARVIHDSGRRAPRARSSTSTAPPSRRRCSRPSCSASRPAPSPTRGARSRACSRRPAGGTLFLDEIDALPVAAAEQAAEGDRGEARPPARRRRGAAASTSSSSPRRSATCASWSPRAASAPTSTTGSRSSSSRCPPLRARGGDVAALAEHFLASHAAAHGVRAEAARRRARARGSRRARWPGNVRELSHLMERVMLLIPDADVDGGDARAAAGAARGAGVAGRGRAPRGGRR